MYEGVKRPQNIEPLNEAFEMMKLRKRYKKYVNMMQQMLKDFKTAKDGVNVVKTFGMNSGLTNSIAAFFGFGSRAEDRKKEIYIGVQPFVRNVLSNLTTNYEKAKSQFNSLVANTDMADETTRAKAINAASSILYQFFDEYMNASKLLHQGGIDIDSDSTINANTFKTYNKLINAYNPKAVGSGVKQFQKLSKSFDDMCDKFDTLGQKLTANFTKYFVKMMQQEKKDDEKIANALEASQVKLSSAWKTQINMIAQEFPAIVEAIISSKEYSDYYEFIISSVLPKVKEYVTGEVAKPNDASTDGQDDNSQEGKSSIDNDEIKPEEEPEHTEFNADDDSSTGKGTSEPKKHTDQTVDAYVIEADNAGDSAAYIFDMPDINTAVKSDFDEDKLITEADNAKIFTCVIVKAIKNTTVYKFGMSIKSVVNAFNQKGVPLKQKSITVEGAKLDLLDAAKTLNTENSYKAIESISLLLISRHGIVVGKRAKTVVAQASKSNDASIKQQAVALNDVLKLLVQAVKAGKRDEITKYVQETVAQGKSLEQALQSQQPGQLQQPQPGQPQQPQKPQQPQPGQPQQPQSQQPTLAGNESVYVQYSFANFTNLNESESYVSDKYKTYVLTEHCWDNGTYLNPEEHLIKDLRKVLRESSSLSDIAKATKNNQYMSLYEYEDTHKLNTYGRTHDSFSVGNAMCTATVFLYESDGNIVGGKYIGFKKITL